MEQRVEVTIVKDGMCCSSQCPFLGNDYCLLFKAKLIPNNNGMLFRDESCVHVTQKSFNL